MDCFTSETIAEVLELPEDDPRALHVAGCPRCGALLVSYRDFVKAAAPPDADLCEANARLSAFLDANVRGVGRDGAIARGPSLLDRVRGVIAMRPALAGVLIVLLSVTVLWWQPWQPDEPRILRSATVSGDLILEMAEVIDRDTVRLSWRGLGGADRYEVRIFAPDLSPVAVLGPFEDTSCVVDLGGAYPDGASGMRLLWRVIALQKGDEIEASRAGSFEIP